MPQLAEWESFYVIVGGGAAALIGLQFVVMALIAERPQLVSPQAGAAFASPTIVHFSTVLLLAAILRVPWQGVGSASTAWGLVGLLGAAYTVIVARRVRSQTAYRPDLEDWFSHFLLPLAAYLTLALSALAARTHAHEALLGVAAATVLLLFTAIHNAWDAVAYHVFVNMRKAREQEPPNE
jgi:hypothetical protein